MTDGLTTTLMTWEDLINVMDATELPKRRGPYKKHKSGISN
jgi:hypothetical protein